MRPPRVQLTLRLILTLAVVAALAWLAVSKIYRDYPSTDKRIVVVVASVVSGTFGLGAMRRPLVFLAPLLVIWVVMPSVDHPSFNVLNISVGGCFLGWMIGAPVGWISRHLPREGNSLPVASDPPEPGSVT